MFWVVSTDRSNFFHPDDEKSEENYSSSILFKSIYYASMRMPWGAVLLHEVPWGVPRNGWVKCARIRRLTTPLNKFNFLPDLRQRKID